MIITEVSLKNFKSYKNEVISFTEGVNGIIGENGNGKTSIFEAIGYALFDYNPYKNQESLVRKGEKEGEVGVRVVADDGVEYRIIRGVGKSAYKVILPTGEVIGGVKDVQQWILENLFPEFSNPKELRQVFENAIGVPQGTFTTIFGLNESERKKVFDNILQVEDYEKVWTILGGITGEKGPIEEKIRRIREDILRIDAKCSDYENIRREEKELRNDLKDLKIEIDILDREISEKEKILLGLKEKEKKKKELDERRVVLLSEIESLKKRMEKAEKDLEDARRARDIVLKTKKAKEEYERTKSNFETLNKKTREKNSLERKLNEFRTIEARIGERIRSIGKQIGDIEEKEKEIKLIEPEAKKQEEIEEKIKTAHKEIESIENSLRNLKLQKEILENLKRIQKNIASSKRDLDELKERFSILKGEIEKLKKKREESDFMEKKKAGLIEKIEGLRDRVEKAKKDFYASKTAKEVVDRTRERKEEYERLKDEIRNLERKKEEYDRLKDEKKIPLMGEKIKKEEKIGFIRKRLKGLEEEEKKLEILEPRALKQSQIEKEKKELEERIRISEERIIDFERKKKITGRSNICPLLEGIRCTAVSDFESYFEDQISSERKKLSYLHEEMKKKEREMEILGNPKREMEIILSKLKERSNLRKELEVEEKNLSRIEKEIREIDSILSGYDEVEKKIISGKNEMKTLEPSYEEYIRNVGLAEKFSETQKNLCTYVEELENQKRELEIVISRLKEIGFDQKDLNEKEKLYDQLINDISAKKESIRVNSERYREERKRLYDMGWKEEDIWEIEKRILKLEEEKSSILKFIEETEEELNSLGDPKRKIEVLRSEVRKKENLQGELLREEKERERIRKSIEEIKRDLERYVGVEDELRKCENRMKELEPDYRSYVLNVSLSEKFEERRIELEKLKEERNLAEREIKKIETLILELHFDPKILEEEEKEHRNLTGKRERKMAIFDEKKIALERIEKKLFEMEELIEERKRLENELEYEEAFKRYFSILRERIRESKEFIVKEIVRTVGMEAGNIYCEICGDHSQTLQWKENYDVIITERNHEKNFRQLSGGEQMSSALAIRLSLLRTIVNSDFVILDEPTTNMDEERRANLARQINSISGFRQIFVISHDDTFANNIANEIRIVKVNGVSYADSKGEQRSLSLF
ncbi:MAG: AAA family ATPase [Candidatus Syntropharchaeia archaeon]